MPEPERTLVTVGDKLAVGTCADCERRYHLSQTTRHLIGVELQFARKVLPMEHRLVSGELPETGGVAARCLGSGGRIQQHMDVATDRLYAKFSPIETAKASRDRMRADVHALRQAVRLELAAMHSDRIVFVGLLSALPQPLDVLFPACSEARFSVRVEKRLDLNYAWGVSILLRGMAWYRMDHTGR